MLADLPLHLILITLHMASAMRQTPRTATMTIQYRGVRARRLMELSRARESGPLIASEENEFVNWGREDLEELQFPTQLRAPGPGSPVTLTISPRTTQVKFIWDSLHKASVCIFSGCDHIHYSYTMSNLHYSISMRSCVGQFGECCRIREHHGSRLACA